MSDPLTDAQVQEAADFLDAATASGPPLPLIPESCRPQTAADGGRIFGLRWSRNPRPATGWKAAVVGGEMALAPFFEGMVIDAPAALKAGDFVNCIIEAEVAFRLRLDFAPRESEYSADEVLDGVAAAYGVIEAPNIRYAQNAGMPSIAADGIGAQALIIGPEIIDWRDRALESLPCQISINGEVVAQGRDERPNPIEVLVATVNEINRRGMTAEAGQMITTGAATLYAPGEPGQDVLVQFPEIGVVQLMLT